MYRYKLLWASACVVFRNWNEWGAVCFVQGWHLQHFDWCLEWLWAPGTQCSSLAAKFISRARAHVLLHMRRHNAARDGGPLCEDELGGGLWVFHSMSTGEGSSRAFARQSSTIPGSVFSPLSSELLYSDPLFLIFCPSSFIKVWFVTNDFYVVTVETPITGTQCTVYTGHSTHCVTFIGASKIPNSNHTGSRRSTHVSEIFL